MRYCRGEFPTNSTPTIGASFLQRRVMVENVEISLQIWDTAGQERFRSMAPMYYRGAKAAVCVFDITNKESFGRVPTWLRDLRAHADPNVVICLAGNKCDLPTEVQLDQCEAMAKSIGATFHRTSALSGEGVSEVFDTLSRRVAETYRGSKAASKDYDALKLSANNKDKTESAAGGGCC